MNEHQTQGFGQSGGAGMGMNQGQGTMAGGFGESGQGQGTDGATGGYGGQGQAQGPMGAGYGQGGFAQPANQTPPMPPSIPQLMPLPPQGYPWPHPAYGMPPIAGYLPPHGYSPAYGQPVYGGAGGYQAAGMPGMAPSHVQGQGQGRGATGMNEMMAELAGGGSGLSSLTKMLDFDDKEFWKGALVGAAAVLLLTNDSVQQALFGAGAKVKEKAGEAMDKVFGGKPPEAEPAQDAADE